MNCQMKSIYEFLLKAKTGVSTQDSDYVDLGLPSGLLWAKCNIGADNPTDYGDYFMWGSTEPDTDKPCDWAHAPFNDGKNEFNYNYFRSVQANICPNGVLAPEYDAVSIIMGNDWRLPTVYEFKELRDNTKHKWITNYQGSKVNGMVFTPVGFEANGAELDTELFIPASGCRSGYRFDSKAGIAYLWSSSLGNAPYYAHNIYFNGSFCFLNYGNRHYGCCLRGVKNK